MSNLLPIYIFFSLIIFCESKTYAHRKRVKDELTKNNQQHISEAKILISRFRGKPEAKKLEQFKRTFEQFQYRIDKVEPVTDPPNPKAVTNEQENRVEGARSKLRELGKEFLEIDKEYEKTKKSASG